MIVDATKTPESDENTNRIYSLSVADGNLTELAAPKGPFGQLKVSPDGKTLAFIGSRVDGPSPHDLFELALPEGGTPKNLTGALLDRPIQQIAFSQHPVARLEMIVHKGFQPTFGWIESGGAVCTTSENSGSSSAVVPRSFDRANTGAFAYVAGSATQPDELWYQGPSQGIIGTGMCTAEMGFTREQITRLNDSWKSYALAKPELVKYKSFDGLEIEGALLKPANYKPGTRVATIVLVHGGPTGAWGDSIESWGQLLAAHGFAVFYPNIRGSTGYGHKFIEMNRGDWGGGDFKDVMAGVDSLIAQGIADPDKLGIGGWSYGGYMSEWAITQTHRFKAAVSGAGLANLASEFGTESGSSYDEWFYGTPYENLDGFMKSSPVKYLKNAQTPTLILQGDADTTDPIGQSEELYRGLKHYGVEAEMVIYPREPHGLREEKHLVDRLNRIVAWYESHLK